MTSPTHQAAPAREAIGLRRGTLSKTQLTAFGIAAYVPAIGMTSYPFLLLGTAGYGATAAALISLLATLCVGYTIIGFARRYVGTGSLYLFIGKVFGPWARYLTAAGLLLGYIAQIATIFVITGMYVSGLLVSAGAGWFGSRPGQILIYAVAAVCAILVASRGLDASTKVLVTIMAVSVPVVALITIWAASVTGVEAPAQFTLQGSTFFGVIIGVAAAASGIVGFESSAALAYETRDPKRSVPTALILVPLILGTTFLVSTFLQIPGLMRSGPALAEGRSGINALNEVAGLPPFVGQIADFVLAITIFACLVGFVNFSSRFALGLARDGLLPRWFTHVNAAGNPVRTIMLVMLVGFAMIVTLVSVAPGGIAPVYTASATLLVYFWVVPYILIAIGAVRLALRHNELTFRLVLAAILAGAIMAWLIVNAMIFPPDPPADSMVAVFAVLMVLATTGFAIAGARAQRAGLQPEQGEEI